MYLKEVLLKASLNLLSLSFVTRSIGTFNGSFGVAWIASVRVLFLNKKEYILLLLFQVRIKLVLKKNHLA